MKWFRKVEKPKILSCPIHEDYCFEEVAGVDFYYLQECGCNIQYRKSVLPDFRPRGKMVPVTLLCTKCLKNEVTFAKYENRIRIEHEKLICMKCKPKEESKMKCSVCSEVNKYFAPYVVGSDRKLEVDGRGKPICNKCVKKIRGNEMKEFDLRPFEVINDQFMGIRYFIKYEDVFTKEWHKFNDIAYESLHHAAIDFINIIDADKGNRQGASWKISAETINLKSEWTFEDIQAGWFFKSNRGYVFLKYCNDRVVCLYDPECLVRLCIDDTQSIVFSELQEIWAHEKITITNVYDCPELAKALMIERVIT